MNIFDFVQFDEARFAPASHVAANYHRHVQNGYDRMQSAGIVIAGLARNIAHILPATILRVESLGKTFRDYQVVIYENDSSDHTAELLSAWASTNNRVHILSETLDAPVNRPVRCSSRARWMAYYRSFVHQFIVDRLPPADVVCLLDTDLIGGWSPDGIANTFGYDNWDFVGSNGMIYKRLGLRSNHLAHYDAWAYRTDEAMTPLSTCQVNAIHFERGEEMLPIASCFGGLGLYRYEAFADGKYEGEDIEHVGFHRSLIRAGHSRLFLNPSQIVVYGRKHRRLDQYFHFAHSMFLVRRLMRYENWQYHRRIDFSHWGATQLLQMLESSRKDRRRFSAVPNAA